MAGGDSNGTNQTANPAVSRVHPPDAPPNTPITPRVDSARVSSPTAAAPGAAPFLPALARVRAAAAASAGPPPGKGATGAAPVSPVARGSAEAAADPSLPAAEGAAAPAAAAPASASASLGRSRAAPFAERAARALMGELRRSTRYDHDDLWAAAMERARRELPESDVQTLEALREECRERREERLADDAAQERTWFIAQGIVSPPPGAVAPNPAAPQPPSSSDYQLPSAGPAFDPPVRPMADFLVEVRKDMVTPMHLDMAPRGLRNPGLLCYRNAVVAALLNSNRLLSFLYAHARRVRTYIQCSDVSGHLLTRLYHLAVAYWERGGVHPMSRRKRDTWEKMHTLFWRACKVDVGADGLAVLANGNGGGSGSQQIVKSWRTLCDEQGYDEESASGSGSGSSSSDGAARDRSNEQQDAIEFFDWLAELAGTQLDAAPARYLAAQSRDYYDCLFRIYLTTRFVCRQCRRPVRLRRCEVDRVTGLKVIVQDKPAPRKRVQHLVSYLHSYFNEDITGGARCGRCKESVEPLRRMRRMQTAPEVLTVHLQRATWDVESGRQVKLSTVVDFPDFLDVSPWLEPHVFAPGTRVLYRLSAVVSHAGADTHRGHYVSYVRSGGGTGIGGDGDGDSAPAATGAPFKAVHEYEEVLRAMRESRERTEFIHGRYREVGERTRRERAAGRGPTNKEIARRIREVEQHDSGWARIDDAAVVPGIPFAKITNASHDPDYRSGGGASSRSSSSSGGSPDWFDPVLLVYEKWVEKYVVDKRTGQRVFQVPMNEPATAAAGARERTGAAAATVEAQARATGEADVYVPEKWPPRRATTAPRTTFAPGRGDDGVDGRSHAAGLENGKDDDGDTDGDGGGNAETFFGWGAYEHRPPAAAAAPAIVSTPVAPATAAPAPAPAPAAPAGATGASGTGDSTAGDNPPNPPPRRGGSKSRAAPRASPQNAATGRGQKRGADVDADTQNERPAKKRRRGGAS